ncbi:MAG: hypothetical protein CSA09_00520 [Candidatus Contendobacter odensis]|uniref:Permease n=1 Tax=Candidatus Contendibacter odensensis TaxID=1400860 RepID=A0A2G6PFQ9_9GAMM|nr:MAG: hypothetical protein CSA09_00520 [Candidatus Contendobacter odensis]
MVLLNNFVGLFVESAPWLALGLLISGIMKIFVTSHFLSHHLGKPGLVSTIKAALLGAPLPLCSCGVIPAAIGLRRSGASKAATTSFLISTPETGVDSVSISYAMLGPFMAIVRPIAAIASAIIAGILVGHDEEKQKTSCSQEKLPPDQDSCCSSESTKTVSVDSCCNTESCNTGKQHVLQRIKDGLQFTFIDLLKDISLWLLIGFIFAALIRTFVPIEFLAQWGDSLLAFVVMALIGVPMYICATASTPIAAGLLFSGVSPGAVLIFLLVGPATNIATIGLVQRELGHRALAAYLGSVVSVAFIFGFFTNHAASIWEMDFLAQTEHVHNLVNPLLAYSSSILLAVLMCYALYKRFFPDTPSILLKAYSYK